ncbi:MAG TPA: type IV pilus secretin PilQ [Desulfobacterales bacterium]|nr:type IV pilus secretin PilQ [Desulfobacterales bacterium]
MMTYPNTKRRFINPVLIALLLTAGLTGCASQSTTQVKRAEADKLITDIITSEDAENLFVTVKGSQRLAYTAVKQDFPLGVQFYFPGTALDNLKESYYPPENDTISAIRATEVAEGEQASRIFIALKRDAAFELTPEGADIKIAFRRATAAAAAGQPAAIKETDVAAAAAPPAPAAVPAKPWSAATEITGVKATSGPDGALITVEANGALQDYKSFTLAENPPRIVFDISAVRSAAKSEQRIGVKGGPVDLVRYLGYPDKVRLVIHTQKPYFAQYSAEPTATGLVIRVGAAPATAPGRELKLASGTAPAAPAKPEPAASGAAALVNRVEFAGEAAGKSTVIIGTTRPVQYDLVKTSDRRASLRLMNTHVPEQHLRPLITSRFDSAVDRVTPSQDKQAAVVAIDLREGVSYSAEQVGNVIRVNFADSAIPPKPYEDAQPPAWKAGTATIPEGRPMPAYEPMPAKGAAASKTVAVAKAVSAVETDSKEKEKVYTGEKIALDFYDTDIKNVFRILQEISGKNFAIDKGVTGKVTLALQKPVPWDQVLDLVLKMNQLGVTQEGDILRVASLATLQQEEKMRQAQLKAEQDSKKQEEEGEPLVTVYLPVNYSTAKTEVLPHLSMISTKDRGKISVDERNNQIIFTDTAEKVKMAKEIVAKIDTVTAQVSIEARVVEANSTFSREIGFDWGTITIDAFKIGGAAKVGPTTYQANNIPTTFRPDNTLGFNFSTLFGTNIAIVDAKLSASELEGKTTIISSPKIVTLNHKEAIIKQGLEIPYQEPTSSGLTSAVVFKKVDLLLKVTPNVSMDHRIVMKIFITKNDVVDPTAQVPALSTNEATTEILVDDGDTIVIGGILKDTKKLTEQGIPGLRKLPAMGWLFRSERSELQKNELLIFITPRVIQMEQRQTM